MSRPTPTSGLRPPASDPRPPTPTSTPRRSPLVDLAVLGLMAILLVAVLMWLVGFQGMGETPESVGSSLSSGPRGELALYRWLERSGFDVSRAQGGEDFPPDADTLVMVNPNQDFPEGQAGSVRRWVEDGHTLILTLGSNSADLSAGLGKRHPMLRELDIDFGVAGSYTSTVPPAQPLLYRPAVAQVSVPGTFGLNPPVGNSLVLASSRDAEGHRVVLVSMLRVGNGRVFVLSSDYPASNTGIGEADNGGLLYNMVQMSGGKRVAFDEAHHGVSSGGDILALLTNNPWGWALIYAAVLAALYFLWSARRLGPPLPVWQPDQRRPTSDYVTSAAGLFRRARKPGYAAERYLQFFKRTLSRHAELDPYLTDRQFVESLSERGRYAFDPAKMEVAIERLRTLEGVGEGRPASEETEFETVKAIREAEEVRRQALGLNTSEKHDV